MGPQEDYIETVFTCEGDINDPNLQSRLEDFKRGLRDLLSTDKRKLIIKKVEPWNSVRVTFNIPREAASRLRQLAQQGNRTLRQLGVLAVQLEGDQLISLTIAGRNNERTQLIFRTADDTVDAPTVAAVDATPHATNEIGTPIPKNVETTRRNIADYLRQGTSLFDSLFAQQNPPDNLRIPNTVALNNDPLSYRTSNSLAGSSRSHLDTSLQSYGPPPNRGMVGFPSPPNATLPSPDASKTHVGQPGLAFPQPAPGHIHSNNQLGLPPPPPYPQGSALMNNVMKGVKGIVTSGTSPLLVNLLQTEPSLAHMNNLINNKMLPPPDVSPPPKKKRRPRKPKERKPQLPSLLSDVSEGEISIQSVPNPALSSYDMPLVTSGSSSHMPPIPMVTQALPATTQPSVTFTTQGRQPVHPSNALQQTCLSDTNLNITPSYSIDSQSKSESADSVQHVIENTVGKIINPITGVLEPMENLSDSSPNKSDSSLDGSSPHKLGNKKGSAKERKSPSLYSHSSISGPIVSTVHQRHDFSNSDMISSVPIPTPRLVNTDPSLRQHYVSNSYMSTSESSSQASQNRDSAFVQSSHNETAVNKGPSFFSPKSLQTQIQNCFTTASKTSMVDSVLSTVGHSNMLVPNPVTSIASTRPVGQSLQKGFSSNARVDQNVKNILAMSASIAKEKKLTSTSTSLSGNNSTLQSHSAYHQSLQQSSFAELSATGCEHSSLASNSEHLLNSQINPAKNPSLSNCEADSPGGDSENSSQSSLPHDVHMQNDIGAVSSEHDQSMKSYNHDSGVGSSSERSDDTPSEPGDNDFKTGHANGDDCSSKSNFIDSVQKPSNAKPDSQVITVGYAMSDQHLHMDSKHQTDISTIQVMNKVLNHPKLNNLNCMSNNKLGKNMTGLNHQVNTVLHWSTEEKILANTIDSNKRKSPKQFLKKDSLSAAQNLQRANPYMAEQFQQLENYVKKVDGLPVTQKGQMPSYAVPSCSRNSSIPSDQSLHDSNRRSPYSSLSVPYTTTRTPSPRHHTIKHADGFVTNENNVSSVKCNSNSVQRSYAENFGAGHAAFSEIPHTNAVTQNSLSNGPISHSTLSSHYTCATTLTNAVPNSSAVMTGQMNLAGHDTPQNFKHFLAQKMAKEQNVGPSTNGPLSISDTELAIQSMTQGVVGHEFSTASKSSSMMSSKPSSGTLSKLNSASLTGVNVERKGKSPVIYGPGGTLASESVSLENSVCFTSATESENIIHTQVNCDFDSGGLEQKGAEHLLKSQIHNNIEQQKGSNITSKYTRKSPASSMLNSLSQQYFNPALPLPLAKRLTESVQKLVKPLPFSDSSTLPQSQRKFSVSTAGNKANANPPSSNSTRINRTQHEFGSAKHGSGCTLTESFPMHDFSSPHLENSVVKSVSDFAADECFSVDDKQTKSVENRLRDDTDYLHKELISNSVVSTVSTVTSSGDCVKTTVTELRENCLQSSAVASVSLSSSVGNSLDSAQGICTVSQPILNLNGSNSSTNSNKFSEISAPVTGTMSSHVIYNTPISSSYNIAGENLHSENKSDTHLGNSQELNSHLKNMPYSESVASSVNSYQSRNSQASNCDDRLVNKDDPVINSSQDTTVAQSRSVECNKSAVRDTQKSVDTTPVTQHCKVSESNVISLSSQNLQQDSSSEMVPRESSTHNSCSLSESFNLEQTGCTDSSLPKYTIVKTQKAENSVTDNPNIHMQLSKDVENPSAGSEAAACSDEIKKSSENRSLMEIQVQNSGVRQSKQLGHETGECSDESQPPLTMTLRKRNISESSDTSPTLQHNLRPKKTNSVEGTDGIKQTANESEASTMSLRTSRRRKNAQNELDLLEPNKKANVEEVEVVRHATRSTDVKENITVVANKSEAERKVEPLGINCSDESNDSVSSVDTIKTGLRARSQPKGGQVELKSGVKELSTRRNSQSRRSRQSPTPIQDKSVAVSTRDKSPVRGSRTRGQISPNVEQHEEVGKRSTRSTSTNTKPKDATEALPPSNKRRRTSRDHR